MDLISSFMTPLVAGPWYWMAIAVVLGYLLGSIPFGFLLTRAAGLGDVRHIGSGNIGATNVLRTGNKGLAATTLLLDAGKGTAAVLLASHYIGEVPAMLAGLGALLGHDFPLWLKFKGGKGVSTYLGVLLALSLKVAAVFAFVWFAVAVATRISSLAAIVATIAAPFAAFALGDRQIAVVATLMSLIVLLKHHANIRRLLAGKEPRIGAKA